MPVLDQDEKQDEFPTPDPHVYQPEEDDEEEEVDRRIRRAGERIRRLTIVGAPDDSDDDESCDTVVAGAWDTGYEVNKTCVSKKPVTFSGACCIGDVCTITTEQACIDAGGVYQGNNTPCDPNPCATTCCDRDIDEISSISITLSIDAVFHGTCGTGSRSDNFTWNFTRIDSGDTFDCVTDQFKLFLTPLVDGCCSLAFEDSATACSSGVYSHVWDKADDICADGDFRFPTFDATFDEDCNGISIDLPFNNFSVVEARYGGDEFCEGASCTYFQSELFLVDLATGISVTTCDFSGLIGTYSVSNTNSSDPNADITITVDMTIS